MDLQSVLQSLSESIATKATVKTVFGDPVATEGRTVIPVAHVKFGFGAGGGAGDKPQGQKGEGGGGGGGGKCTPLGVVEISAEGTKWIPINQCTRLARALAIGFFVGLLMAKCRRRCRRHCCAHHGEHHCCEHHGKHHCCKHK
jgi:uncharacterized spore protein YtfJ